MSDKRTLDDIEKQKIDKLITCASNYISEQILKNVGKEVTDAQAKNMAKELQELIEAETKKIKLQN